MPAITREGFIDITSIDLLIEPSEQWDRMNRVLRKYNLPVYKRWGDLPRSVLPPLPKQAMLDRVMATAEIARLKASKDIGTIPNEERLQIDVRTAIAMFANQYHWPEFPRS
ncbi:hypothetical protein C0989_000191 [Termitomyces sp. Mn162]|nr:hypothetical protein C0989_000191 [Termitomyces sp. Mn162]